MPSAFDPGYEYAQLGAWYAEAEGLLAWPDARLFEPVPAASGWSAAQHLYHVLLSNHLIFRTLRYLERRGEAAGAGEERAGEAGALVLRSGRMARGRTAPDRTVPPDAIERAELQQLLARNRQVFEELAPLVPALARLPGRVPHSVFGPFDAVEWLRFAGVHARHHLALIREIDAARI